MTCVEYHVVFTLRVENRERIRRIAQLQKVREQIPYRELIRMFGEYYCETQMWQHKAAELLYEPACFEPACPVQIMGTSCEPGT